MKTLQTLFKVAMLLSIINHLNAQSFNENIRALHEINTSENAEAYPFISNDGLRIYYSQGNMELSNIYFASRVNKNSLFEKKGVLCSAFPTGSYSCWLTSNELEIFFIVKNSIYHSKRISMNNKFSLPTEITLMGKFSGFLGGISLSNDKKELFLYNDNNTQKRILRFELASTNSYKLSNSLAISKDLEIGSGLLSKDGLKYYLSVGKGSSKRIYSMNRKSNSNNFENLKLMESSFNKNNCIQPSVSGNEEIMVFVNNNTSNWNGNDLYISEAKPLEKKKEIMNIDRPDQNTFNLNAFPNPASNSVKFSYTLPKTCKSANLTITSSTGEVFSKIELNPKEPSILIDTDQLPNGLYICSVVSSYSLVSTKFLVVK